MLHSHIVKIMIRILLLVGSLAVVLANAQGRKNAFWEEDCGYSQYPDAGREQRSPDQHVIGGWDARVHEFPYMLLMYADGNLNCGASIINEYFVLTGAHCTDGRSPSQLTIGVGEHQRSDPPTVREIHTVVEKIEHEGWNPDTIQHDIGLLRLAEPIEYADYAFPVCPPDTGSDYAGETSTVSGWGLTGYPGGNVADTLQYTNMPVMSFAECQGSQGGILDGMLCAGYAGSNDRDACTMDSGGPLVVKNANNRFEQVGVVSWGAACAGSTPGVYADVIYYMDWINDNINRSLKRNPIV